MLGAMAMPLSFRYRDVFLKGRPRHEKFDMFWCKHPPMDPGHWAKIFSPFDALKGFDDSIASKEVLYVDKAEPDDQRMLDHKLHVLHGYTFNGRMARANKVCVTVNYFVPCSDPDNYAFDLHQGRYEKVTGIVMNVDETMEMLKLQTDGESLSISFGDILDIDSEKEGLFEQDVEWNEA